MRRRSFISFAAAIASVLPVIAAPSLPITTLPVIVGSASTRPASITVLLTPFRSIGESTQSDWIGQAIEEELASDLNRDPSVRVVRMPTTKSSFDGLSEARQAQAQRLVVGTYQTVDDQVRISGEVVDPSDGKSVGHLRVTGAKHDLFKLEDSLAAELLHVLPNADEPDQSFTVTPVASDGMMQQAGAQQPWAQQPVVIQSPPGDAAAGDPYAGVVYPTNPNVGYGYGDGYGNFTGYGYGYGYPYFDSPLFVYIRGGRSHSGNDHGGYGGRGGLVGGGPIVPTQRVPTYSNGEAHNSVPASLTPSHGFVGPQGPAAASHGGGGGGGGRR